MHSHVSEPGCIDYAPYVVLAARRNRIHARRGRRAAHGPPAGNRRGAPAPRLNPAFTPPPLPGRARPERGGFKRALRTYLGTVNLGQSRVDPTPEAL